MNSSIASALNFWVYYGFYKPLHEPEFATIGLSSCRAAQILPLYDWKPTLI